MRAAILALVVVAGGAPPGDCGPASAARSRTTTRCRASSCRSTSTTATARRRACGTARRARRARCRPSARSRRRARRARRRLAARDADALVAVAAERVAAVRANARGERGGERGARDRGRRRAARGAARDRVHGLGGRARRAGGRARRAGPAWAAPALDDGALRPVRDKAALPALVRDLGLTGEGAELGVAKGDFSLALLAGTELLDAPPRRRVPLARGRPVVVRRGGASAARAPGRTRRRARACARRAATRSSAARASCARSRPDAAATVADRSLDFVYVDASHDYASVAADPRAWWPKLRAGGLFCGNDYFTGLVRAADAVFGVKDAVDEFFAEKRLRVQQTVTFDTTADIAPDWCAGKRSAKARRSPLARRRCRSSALHC